MTMTKKANIAIFIPHAGCPHQCSFCNQRKISGQWSAPTPLQVQEQLAQAVANLSPLRPAEIAFFGGSFTALEREYMVSLLEVAHSFLGGNITGIRVSTRPDAITKEIVSLLQQYGVTAVELGAQSTNDAVLAMNRRGHTREDIIKASQMIHQAGLELGLQMMTGLYGSSPQLDKQTALDLLACSPKTMRIYPTVVFPETHLYTLYQQGEYTPPTLEETIPLCSELLLLCHSQGVSVIRLGLHGDSSLEGGIGPCHPALREVCQSHVYYETVCRLLPVGWHTVTLRVHPTCLSQAIGQKRENINRWAEIGCICNVVGDHSIPPHGIGIKRKENFHVPEILGSTGLQILSR